MSNKQVILRRGKDESLRRFHPWVFSGAINQMDNDIEEGDTVSVFSHDMQQLGVGHYQDGSIAVRILSFENDEIDANFWRKRLSAALDVRIKLGLVDNEHNNTYRLVHGEGDFLPGLIIDIYGNTAVMQAHSIGMYRSRKMICEALLDVMAGRVVNIYDKSEGTLQYKMRVGEENDFLVGKSDDNVAMENGLLFKIDWLHGQKTGFFVDQRDNRMLVERYAKGRRVLNLFCYTGAFSVYAMRGGAESVHSVDSSAKAISLAESNVAMNFPNDSRHQAFCEDAFKYLEQSTANYDFMILDPPAFAKHRGAIHNALKGYIRLNAKAIEKIEKGGIIFTFSCSQAITKEHFRQAVFTAAAQAKRRVRILYQLHQPADHPISIYHPEGEYLKGLVIAVE